jgi:hypothetical protein
MEAKDIIFKDDIQFFNGDFLVGDSDTQHVEHIIKLTKGQVRNEPLLGVGIIETLNGAPNKQQLKQSIRRQLVLDNYSVDVVEVDEDININVYATRIR